jgi:membrane fusion protein (multidrug efflux system)
MEGLDSSNNTQEIKQLGEQTKLLHTETTAITPADNNGDIQQGDDTPPSRKKKKKTPKKSRKALWLTLLLGGGLIAAGVAGYRWWEYDQAFPGSDDAYISGDIVPITSRVSGIVTGVGTTDNEKVTPGTVLVKIDPREFQVNLAQAKAFLESTKQQAAVAKENVKIVTANAQAQKPPALPGKPAPPTTGITSSLSEINQRQLKVAEAAVNQTQAQVKNAELQLSYTTITAPIAGQITNKNVQVGQKVKEGDTLMKIVQPFPWIIANFKETQLAKLQPGQPVDIKMIAFPGRKFRGKIDSFSAATGESQGDISKNNTGVKGQKIPVKVVFDSDTLEGIDSKIVPGMSASVTVHTK